MTQNELKDLELREKRPVEKAEGTRKGPYFEPRVDIYETPIALTVVADLPGTTNGNLEVDLAENVLTLTARVNEPDKRWRPIYEEYRIGHYSRQFRVGGQVDQGKIAAKMKDGVLTLSLPKVETAHPRKIRVETAD